MPTYKFERIAEDLREQIRSGQLPKGSALPSTKNLIDQYGVAYGTIRDAIRQLKAEGLIEGRPGDGVYVV